MRDVKLELYTNKKTLLYSLVANLLSALILCASFVFLLVPGNFEIHPSAKLVIVVPFIILAAGINLWMILISVLAFYQSSKYFKLAPRVVFRLTDEIFTDVRTNQSFRWSEIDKIRITIYDGAIWTNQKTGPVRHKFETRGLSQKDYHKLANFIWSKCHKHEIKTWG